MKFSRTFAALALAGAILFFHSSARAELKLPAIFSDNMMLQQNQPVPVWGWSAPRETVTVSFGGQTKSTRARADGKWLVKLDQLKMSAAPQTLIIESGETKTLTNILVGEVWLAFGQSNMEKPIGHQTGQKPVLNSTRELAGANYPNIRIFKVEKNPVRHAAE